MLAKRDNARGYYGGPSRSAKEPRLTTTDESRMTNANQQLQNAVHGNIFHLKLLMLFLIRGIRGKYQFQLRYEMPVLAGKFDDIIFKYKDKDGENRCSYLQAKHKLGDNKAIEPDDLIDVKGKKKCGEFNLDKYFRSYCRCILPRGDLDYLIICTNIGFDESKFESYGIKLKPFSASCENSIFGNILSFKSQPDEQKIYFQLEIPIWLKTKLKNVWKLIY